MLTDNLSAILYAMFNELPELISASTLQRLWSAFHELQSEPCLLEF